MGNNEVGCPGHLLDDGWEHEAVMAGVGGEVESVEGCPVGVWWEEGVVVGEAGRG